MRFLPLLSFTVLTLMAIGCEKSMAQNNKYDNHPVYEATAVTSQNKNTNDDPIIMHTVINPKTGQPSMYIPFPSDWKIIEKPAAGQPAIKGPNGLTCIVYAPQSYVYTNDSMMNQSYQSSGLQVMAPLSIENTLNQVIFPQIQQMGMALLNQYPFPEIAAKDREYSVKISGDDSTQNIFQAIGTEWKDGEGNKVLVVLHYSELRSNYGITWGYYAEMLKVQQSGFEKAKQQYVYAMANKVFNQNDKIISPRDEWIIDEQNINKPGGRRARISDPNEYIRNPNREVYENKVQQQTSNTLNNVNVVVSPFDGKEYQVESGNKTYWINNEGKYIKSDDPLFDPNKYEDSVGVWKKAPQKVYK